MAIWPYETAARRRAASGQPYAELSRSDSMSIGVYVLGPGAVDRQSPHTEDEIYVVIRGKARLTIDGSVHVVGAGDTIFVPAGVAHRFHDIADELHLIVVFAPPEGSASAEA
jgi:mannose-6-phosphate isomerase-like protein (cupin superfamily)